MLHERWLFLENILKNDYFRILIKKSGYFKKKSIEKLLENFQTKIAVEISKYYIFFDKEVRVKQSHVVKIVKCNFNVLDSNFAESIFYILKCKNIVNNCIPSVSE